MEAAKPLFADFGFSQPLEVTGFAPSGLPLLRMDELMLSSSSSVGPSQTNQRRSCGVRR